MVSFLLHFRRDVLVFGAIIGALYFHKQRGALDIAQQLGYRNSRHNFTIAATDTEDNIGSATVVINPRRACAATPVLGLSVCFGDSRQMPKKSLE